MPKSVKHHYIPRYYLKGFTDDEGSYFVYDKENKRIFKGSPDTTFYENHRNSIDFGDGSRNDNYERLYADIDNRLAKSFSILKNWQSDADINEDDLATLYVDIAFFVSIHRCRVPHADAEIQVIANAGTFEDLGYTIKGDGKPITNEMRESLMKTDMWKHFQDLPIALLPISKGNAYKAALNTSIFYDGNDMGIICDNPVITPPGSSLTDFSEFVIPLTRSRFAVSSLNLKPINITKEFLLKKELALVHQAKRFVACKDENFLKNLIIIYQTSIAMRQDSEIINGLFRHMNN